MNYNNKFRQKFKTILSNQAELKHFIDPKWNFVFISPSLQTILTIVSAWLCEHLLGKKSKLIF